MMPNTLTQNSVGDILTANCVERAARGEVLVKCLRMTADQAALCADAKILEIDAKIDADLDRAREAASRPL
jgi:hypothetical protein